MARVIAVLYWGAMGTAGMPWLKSFVRNAGDARGVCDWHKEGIIAVNCEGFRVRVGLWGSSVGPAIEVTTGGRRIVLEPHDVEDGSWPAGIPPQGLLCERRATATAGRHRTRSTEHGPALVMAASSFSYLFRLWPYFVRKVLWARDEGLRVVVRIGDLPRRLATTSSKVCRASMERARTTKANATRRYGGTKRSWYDSPLVPTLNSNHHAKLLASLAALRNSSSIVYADLDVVPRGYATDLTQIHQDRRVDLLFPHIGTERFWHAKSFTFFARRTPEAVFLIANWLANRCGFKDQYSLWHSMLDTGRHAGCFSYHDEIYLNYSYYAILESKFRPKTRVDRPLSCKAWRERCPNLRFCDARAKHQLKWRHSTIAAEYRRPLAYFSRTPDGSFSTHIVVFQDMDPKLDNFDFLRTFRLDAASRSNKFF